MLKGNILITGASTGIGRACAVRFAELGYRVIAGVRNLEHGEPLTKLVKGVSGQIQALMLDVTEQDTINKACQELAGLPLAGLINNAGIAVTGPLELIPIEKLRTQLEVNVIGLIAVSQAFLPMLRLAKGHIVNIGSIAGRSPLPCYGPYACSKFAVEALSDVLRMELFSTGISVSLIEAGAISTPIWEKGFRDADELERSTRADLLGPYKTLIKNIRRRAEEAAGHAIPVDVAVNAVVHAITARKPRTRYVVGKDAKVALLLNILPDRWRDRLILTSINDKNRP